MIGIICEKCRVFLQTGQKDRAGLLREIGESSSREVSGHTPDCPLGKRYTHRPRKLPVQAPNAKQQIEIAVVTNINHLVNDNTIKLKRVAGLKTTDMPIMTSAFASLRGLKSYYLFLAPRVRFHESLRGSDKLQGVAILVHFKGPHMRGNSCFY